MMFFELSALPPVIAGIGSLASDSAREVRNSGLAYTRCFQMGLVFITDPLVFAKESTVWEVSAGLPYSVVGSTRRRAACALILAGTDCGASIG